MKRIDELFAWVALDPADSTEGIVGMRMPNGDWCPLVGADDERLESYRDIVQTIANGGNTTIRLLRFATRSELGKVLPKGS